MYKIVSGGEKIEETRSLYSAKMGAETLSGYYSDSDVYVLDKLGKEVYSTSMGRIWFFQKA